MENIQDHDSKMLIKELKKNEERFSLALKGANDGIWDWNLLTDEVYYSPRWKNMLGYEEFELSNHLNTWAELVHPEDKVLAYEEVQNCIDGKKEEFELEMRMKHKNGHEVFVLSRAFLVRSEFDQKPIRLVGTHVDITERKKSEDFIKSTNKILEMIALGKPASEVYDSIALMYEKKHPGLRCSLLELEDGRLLHGGAPSMPKEYCDAVHGLKNGPNVGSCGTSTYYGKRVLVENINTDPKWENIKAAALPHGMRCCWSEPIIDSEGKVLGAFGMYHDYPALPNEEESEDLFSAARLTSIVMERDQAHKRKARDQKIIANQSKMAAMGEMLENIAHQWRQPLSAISTSATGAKLQKELASLSDEQLDLALDKINDSAQYLSQTIDDFRNFFSPISDKESKFNISNTINKTLNILNSQFKAKDIEIIQNIKSINLYSLESELIQVLINILNNSRDALILNNLKRKLIFIDTYLKDNVLFIEILDNANGINEDIIDRVFEPYFTTKHKSQGTGIGLYMSKDIVNQRLSGKLYTSNERFDHENVQYVGAKFTIEILAKNEKL